MFNPKQALQRIRKQKIEHQQNPSDPLRDSHSNRPLFPQFAKAPSQPYSQQPISSLNRKQKPFQSQQSQTLQQRMAKLQSLVSNLSEKLTQSNQTITELKAQNSQLEAHVLKLSHENSQLKNVQKQQDSSKNNSNLVQRLSSSISGVSQNNRKVLNGLSSEKAQIRKAESKVIEDDIMSPEVEEAMEEIKKQPIQNILKKREHNFRALKNASKESLVKGEKALRELANLHKEYGKNYKKPTLIINLSDADFE